MSCLPHNEHILYCHCIHYDLVDAETTERIIRAVEGSGRPFSLAPDLCGLCAGKDAHLSRWAEAKKLIVIACHPRAVKWLFHAGGVDLDGEKPEFFNAREEGAAGRIEERLNAAGAPEKGRSIEKPSGGWIPWFPVIDYSLCVHCKKCEDFCLFGVYDSAPDGRVRVSRPRACKTNCPACARICPQGAIIFPKHETAPVNGGPAGSGTDDSEAVGVDHESLLQGDIYEKLRGRSGTGRFSAAPQEQRRREKTVRNADIPPGVLQRLSPDELAEAVRRIRENEDTSRPG